MQALPHLNADTVLVVLGDTPLLTTNTLQQLLGQANSNTLALLTVESADPTGLGRIVRNTDGCVAWIVEHKDASSA